MLADMSSKFVRSSLHSVLAAGAAAGDGFRIQNPDYQELDNGDSKDSVLSGHEAYLKAVSQSMVGTGLATSSVINPLLESLNGKWPGKDKSSIQDSDGVIYTHDSNSYRIDTNAPSLGARPVALFDELDDDEAQIYVTRGTLLKQFINEISLTLGFSFDIPDQLKDYKFNQTNAYAISPNGQDNSVESSLISAPSKKAYISAALIECLLMLCDPTKGISISRSFWFKESNSF